MKRIILLVSIVLSLSGCFSEKTMIVEKPLYVETYTVTESVIVGKKYFQGTTVPADLSPLAFRSDGKLKTLAVKSGDKVSKGDVIATLDTTRIEQQLQETKVQAELANKQFNRAETLKHKGMISNAEYDELKATKSLTYIQYRMLQQQMKHAQLIAPFNGTVAVINAENYQNVNALETILSIYRANSTYIDIPVSETLIAQLKALPDARKVKASIQFADKSGEYQAKLKLYSGEPIPELKGYLARFELT
ncbi:MAG: efflux RND transporter periplasmic adaptor subunit, partial [Psychromonas sp.]